MREILSLVTLRRQEGDWKSSGGGLGEWPKRTESVYLFEGWAILQGRVLRSLRSPSPETTSSRPPRTPAYKTRNAYSTTTQNKLHVYPGAGVGWSATSTPALQAPFPPTLEEGPFSRSQTTLQTSLITYIQRFTMTPKLSHPNVNESPVDVCR